MSIRFYCEECGKPLKVRSANAGRYTQCPECHGIIRIPRTSRADVDVDEIVPVAELDESPAASSRRSSKSRRASRPKDSDPPFEFSANRSEKPSKRNSNKNQKNSEESSSVPVWLIVVGCCTVGLLSIGGFIFFAINMKLLPLPGSGQSTAKSKAFATAETLSKNGKFKMSWDLPPGWTQESEFERDLWPWFHMKGQGQSIRMSTSRSLTETASTMTTMGGFQERLSAAHTFRIGKLQAENMDYVETRPEFHKTGRNLVVWSDFEYKGLFGKVYGIRCTIPGLKLPCTVTMECSQATRDKWRDLLLRIASSVSFKQIKDDEGKPFVEIPDAVELPAIDGAEKMDESE